MTRVGKNPGLHDHVKKLVQLSFELISPQPPEATVFKEIVTEKRPALAEVSDITFEPYDGEIGRTSDLAMFCSFVQLDKAMPLMLRMEENQRDTVDEI